MAWATIAGASGSPRATDSSARARRASCRLGPPTGEVAARFLVHARRQFGRLGVRVGAALTDNGPDAKPDVKPSFLHLPHPPPTSPQRGIQLAADQQGKAFNRHRRPGPESRIGQKAPLEILNIGEIDGTRT